jgi:hypothetical protein
MVRIWSHYKADRIQNILFIHPTGVITWMIEPVAEGRTYLLHTLLQVSPHQNNIRLI